MKLEIIRPGQFARTNSFYGKRTTRVVQVEVKRPAAKPAQAKEVK